MPVGVNEKITQPSAKFKSDVIKAMGAIVFFILVYLLLVTAACALAILCAYGGVSLMVASPRFITLMLGIGLIGMGLMVIYFLMKFIFKKNKIDRSHLFEINSEEEPELFSFIRKITEETKTPFPKRIYLAKDVNACVFYDSSFWSMFFPVRKNLQIGLGLVNSINISEFKAILAHEFGHFSQRSMKLGSYTYNVNKIIYDMLFDNEGYGSALDKWGSVSGYFAFFANITIKIVQGIQWVLQQVYFVVNKSYMSLSRQMEFHADAVAAFVSGSMPLITSLRRMEVTDLCYNSLFYSYDSWLKDNLKPDNIYPQHTEVMKYFGEHYKIPFEHDSLQINNNSPFGQNKSRLVIKDQWASHPSVEERERHLLSLGINSEMIHQSAWILFRDPERIQRQMTEKIFAHVNFEKTPELLDKKKFAEKYKADTEKNNYANAYKGFYDSRNPSLFTIKEAQDEVNINSSVPFEELFNDSNSNLPSAIRTLENDIQVLDQIGNRKAGIKTFDFDGEKYRVNDAPEIKEKLEAELKELKKQLEELDKEVFRFFYKKAKEKNMEAAFIREYEKVSTLVSEADKNIRMYNEIMAEIQPVYSVMKHDDIVLTIERINEKENGIKSSIKNMLGDEQFSKQINSNQRDTLEKYISQKWEYYYKPEYHQTNLDLMNESLNIFGNVVLENNFQVKKNLFDWQLELLK